MAAGEGMGGGRTGGRGRGRGRAGRGGKKKGGKGTSKQGTLIAGPPRLENVPEDKLDEVFVFREERPGRYELPVLLVSCLAYWYMNSCTGVRVLVPGTRYNVSES